MKKECYGVLLLSVFVLLFCVAAEAMTVTVWNEMNPPTYTLPLRTGLMPKEAIGYFQKNYKANGIVRNVWSRSEKCEPHLS